MLTALVTGREVIGVFRCEPVATLGVVLSQLIQFQILGSKRNRHTWHDLGFFRTHLITVSLP